MSPCSRTLRTAGPLAAVLALATVTGCSGGSRGPTLTSEQAASLAAAGSTRGAIPVASPTGTATGPGASAAANGAGAATAATPGAQLARNAPASCRPGDFLEHAGLAQGALDAYVTKPLAAADPSAAAVRTAAKAAGYAADHLRAAGKAVRSCHSTAALTGVVGQTADVLGRTSDDLFAGRVAGDRISAAEALFADVLSQAGRLALTPHAKTPPRAALG